MRNLPYTEKSDVYSFGIMMWEVLTRENLYPGLHPLSVGYKVREQQTFGACLCAYAHLPRRRGSTLTQPVSLLWYARCSGDG